LIRRAAILAPYDKPQADGLVEIIRKRRLEARPGLIPVVVQRDQVVPDQAAVGRDLRAKAGSIPELAARPEGQDGIDRVAQVEFPSQYQRQLRVGRHPGKDRVADSVLPGEGLVGVHRPDRVQPVVQPRLEGFMERISRRGGRVFAQRDIVQVPTIAWGVAAGVHLEAHPHLAAVFPGGEVNRLLGPVGARCRDSIDPGPARSAITGDEYPAPVAGRDEVPVPEAQDRPDGAAQVGGELCVMRRVVGVVAG